MLITVSARPARTAALFTLCKTRGWPERNGLLRGLCFCTWARLPALLGELCQEPSRPARERRLLQGQGEPLLLPLGSVAPSSLAKCLPSLGSQRHPDSEKGAAVVHAEMEECRVSRSLSVNTQKLPEGCQDTRKTPCGTSSVGR